MDPCFAIAVVLFVVLLWDAGKDRGHRKTPKYCPRCGKKLDDG